MSESNTNTAVLSPQRRAFVEAYLTNGHNATEAALSAGYSPRNARQQGSRLLTSVDIATEIGDRTRKAVEGVCQRTDISLERTLEYLGRLAFYDTRKLYEDDGSLKLMRDIPEEALVAVSGLEVAEMFDGTGEQKHALGLIKKVKLSDRRAALDMLMRYHGQYRDKVEHTGEGGGPVVFVLKRQGMGKREEQANGEAA